MHPRRLVVPAVISACVLAPAAAFAAFAFPEGATNTTTFNDTPTADAPAGVDITQVALYRNATQYRATVSYSALTKERGNRYSIAFTGQPDSTPVPAGRPNTVPIPATSGNIVEFRITPGGQMKAAAYKYNQDATTSPATCSGTTAVPDFTKSHILFIIPIKCWKLNDATVTTAQVNADARHYPAGTFETTTVPIDVETDPANSDFASGVWMFADPTTTPSGSPTATVTLLK